MSRVSVLVFSMLIAINAGENVDHPAICQRTYCECTPATHPNWQVVNCTLPDNQILEIMEGELPTTTTDLIITGGYTVKINTNALSQLSDARLIDISNSRSVVISKSSAMQMNIVNLLLKISKCNVLKIETRSFVSIKGPLSVILKDCQYVAIESKAFSWLLSIDIENVKKLRLRNGSFMLDPTAANVGEHGPGMTIKMKHLTIPEVASQTFGSSAALISMEGVLVRVVRPEAFSANTYNIVKAMNCTFQLIEGESFTQKSLINNLNFDGCVIHHLASGALQSAIAKLNMANTKIDKVETGAINSTVVTINISHCIFHIFKEKAFELLSWNKLYMIGNSFDELANYAIIGVSSSIHEVIFQDNEIELMNPSSLDLLGKAFLHYKKNINYINNYYGQPCNCNMSSWLARSLGLDSAEEFVNESYCTVDEFIARCFDVFDQNMQLGKFLENICNNKDSLKCNSHNAESQDVTKVLKNPRFPHVFMEDDDSGLTERNKKVIGIVLGTIFGCIFIALLFTVVKYIRRGFGQRMYTLATNGTDNVASITQLSVNEYSERHMLNAPAVQENINDGNNIPTVPQGDDMVISVEKSTQTLPEELTKELLENLKLKLEEPENYVAAREMIEHLYELIKVEESCNANKTTSNNGQENTCNLPFPNSIPKIGKNKKPMVNVGTMTPFIDTASPLSPYSKYPPLLHEYFEPNDLSFHLYAEIVNNDRETKSPLAGIPDILEQPRGPYLRAIRDKMNISEPNTTQKCINDSVNKPPNNSPVVSNKSPNLNNFNKMINRPLPEKPANFSDPGEGTSFRSG